MASNHTGQSASFGPFTADLRKKELRRAGRIVRLRGHSWQVLVALLEHPGSVISRDTLQKLLWANNTFVDFDHGLNKAISKIRAVLGDTAGKPRFLETVPGEGYRFIAHINWTRLGAGQEERAEQFIAVRYMRYWIAAVVAVIVILTSLTLHYMRGGNPATLVETKMTSRVAELPVEIAALSPDGKYLAFADREGLWVQVISMHEIHRLGSPPNSTITYIAWFPDSSSLLISVTANAENISSLWGLSIFGGDLRRLRDNAGQGTPSPDGMKIAFTRANSKEGWTITDRGEDPQHIMTAGDGEEIRGFIWSGDSSSIVYRLAPSAWNGHQVKLMWQNLASRKTVVVLDEPRLRAFCGTSDGVVVYSRLESPSNMNEMNLWEIRIDMRTGQVLKAPRRITQFRGDSLSSLSISSDGRILAAAKGTSHTAAYALSLGAGKESRETIVPLTFHDRDDYAVTWDGSSGRVYLNSNRNWKWEIFRQDLERHASEYVVGSTDHARYPVLSPDGRWLLYQIHGRVKITAWATLVSLLKVPLAGGPPQEVWRGQGYYTVGCARLPTNRCVLATRGQDGASVVFSAFDSMTGRGKDLARIATEVTPDGMYYSWALSPDGSQVAFCEPGESGTRIRVISLVGIPERYVMVNGWRDFDSISWTADGKGFFLLTESDNGSTLLRVDQLGTAHVLLARNHPMHKSFAPSPDGKWLAFAELDSSANVFLFSGF